MLTIKSRYSVCALRRRAPAARSLHFSSVWSIRKKDSDDEDGAPGDVPKKWRIVDRKKKMEMKHEVPSTPRSSVEATTVFNLLRFAKNHPARTKWIINSKAARLLPFDSNLLYFGLLRAKEPALAFRVFCDVIRKEKKYEPSAVPYSEMITCFCTMKDDNPSFETVFKLLRLAAKEKISLSGCHFTHLMRRCLRLGDFKNCMAVYDSMKASRCTRDLRFYAELESKLRAAGQKDEAKRVAQDIENYKYEQQQDMCRNFARMRRRPTASKIVYVEDDTSLD